MRRQQQEERDTITLFVPFFNEEAAIEPLRERLLPVIEHFSPRWNVELLLVDDGSTDDTYNRLLHAFPAPVATRVVLLRHLSNRGIGGAMRSAFEAATGDIICSMDSDCTYAPEKVPEMVELLLRENADIVTGSPYHPHGHVQNVVPQRLLLSKTASRMYAYLAPAKLYCYTSFFRVYRRDWARTDFFQSNGFLAVTEYLLSAARAGAKIIEYPTVMGARVTGQSKMRVAKVTLDHLRLMSRTAVLNAVLGKNMASHTVRDYIPRSNPSTRKVVSTSENIKEGKRILRQWTFVGQANLDASPQPAGRGRAFKA